MNTNSQASNAVVTKEEERKALDKITKIINDLGPDSYIAIAFEGCLNDATRNIEEDAAYSMASRYQKAYEDAERLHNKVLDLRSQLKSKDQALTEAEKRANEMSSFLTTNFVYTNIDRVVEFANNSVNYLQVELTSAKDAVVNSCEDTDSPEFIQARSHFLAFKEKLEIMNKMFNFCMELVKLADTCAKDSNN